jgi:hypothetical protein
MPTASSVAACVGASVAAGAPHAESTVAAITNIARRLYKSFFDIFLLLLVSNSYIRTNTTRKWVCVPPPFIQIKRKKAKQSARRGQICFADDALTHKSREVDSLTVRWEVHT